MSRSTDPSSQGRLLKVINAALQRKARAPIILKVREYSSIADFFFICSGTSDRQVKAIASWLEESLGKQGIFPRGIEGKEYGHWILMDYDDIIVHIFYEPVRAFYDLEKLWHEAPQILIDENATEIKELKEGFAD
ncbi:MAG: ribosome silencing factor [Syntrophales bacterium]|nr:ribosome silencing factor [Syntrophales bacterium]